MNSAHPGSFRDPSGTLYTTKKGTLLRTVHPSYKINYRMLMDSGLYEYLRGKRLLIQHNEQSRKPEGIYAILAPEHIPFVSYPYEWCFSAYKDAALTTLEIQKISLSYGMSLKDASAYNIQFHKGAPVLIDTLSFEAYEEGLPWIAYRQFCMHFLAPLLLMAFKNPGLNKLMQVHLDGIPLSLVSALLPKKTYLNIQTATHIHLHAVFEKRTADISGIPKNKPMKKQSLLLMLDALTHLIGSLSLSERTSHWNSYYDTHAYSKTAFGEKISAVESFLKKISGQTVLDIGSNTGMFSDIVTGLDKQVVAIDNDHASIDRYYTVLKKRKETRCLPLVVDITNPSPGIGWENTERTPFVRRGIFDAVLALALTHHLTIGNNVPFEYVARLFCRLGKYCIMEYIPKNDPQLRRLLGNRKDIFDSYTKEHFEKITAKYFVILNTLKLKESGRILYCLKSKQTV